MSTGTTRTGRPQYRTLVKMLQQLADRVEGDIFTPLENEALIDAYRPLRKLTNDAFAILGREKKTRKKKERDIW